MPNQSDVDHLEPMKIILYICIFHLYQSVYCLQQLSVDSNLANTSQNDTGQESALEKLSINIKYKVSQAIHSDYSQKFRIKTFINMRIQ